MSTATLMGDGNSIAYENLYQYRAPAATRSWSPIPWEYFVKLVMHRVELAGWSITDVNLMVSGKNKETGMPMELFGTIGLDSGSSNGIAPQLALRTSYNMHYATGVCAGARVLVCSNGMFIGEHTVVLRKQTTNALRDIAPLVDRGVDHIHAAYDQTRQRRDNLTSVSLDLNQGYALIGKAIGNEVITPTMANVAFADWRNPRHEEFAGGDAWGLYNCLTEGAKKTRAGNLLDAHTKIDSFFAEQIEETASRAMVHPEISRELQERFGRY